MAEVHLLDEEEIEQRLDELSADWEREGDEILKVYEFDDFPSAIKFVTGVAKLADRYDHHPDIDIRYTKITCTLSTHDAGGITQKDLNLAAELDQLAGDAPA